VKKKQQHREQRSKREAGADVKRRPLAWAPVFQSEFREDLRHWFVTDPRTADRVLNLVQAITLDPFTGIGKPEPLQYELAGCWSRRLTQEHRIVYMVRENRVDFLQCRYHY
jgi:toxin YoeB